MQESDGGRSLWLSPLIVLLHAVCRSWMMGDCCGRVHQQLCYMLCAGVWQQQWSRLRTMPVTWVSCSWSWTSGNARGWMIERSPCGPRTSSWLVSFEREDQQLFVCLFVYLVMVSLCPNSGIAANWFIVAIQWEKNNSCHCGTLVLHFPMNGWGCHTLHDENLISLGLLLLALPTVSSLPQVNLCV